MWELSSCENKQRGILKETQFIILCVCSTQQEFTAGPVMRLWETYDGMTRERGREDCLCVRVWGPHGRKRKIHKKTERKWVRERHTACVCARVSGTRRNEQKDGAKKKEEREKQTESSAGDKGTPSRREPECKRASELTLEVRDRAWSSRVMSQRTFCLSRRRSPLTNLKTECKITCVCSI